MNEMSQIVRRYKFRLYPSPQQERYLGRIFGAVRFVYNSFLAMNKDLYEDGGFQKLSRSEMQETLTIWKEAFPWLSEVPSQPLQVACHDLDVAYQNFFNKQNKAPRFKKKSQHQSFQLPQPKIENGTDGPNGSSRKYKRIFLPVFKTYIPLKIHREFPKNCKMGGATISKTPTDQYFVSFVVQFDSKAQLKSASEEALGVDVNIKGLVLSDGEVIKTPQALQTLEKRKRRLQKSLQRKRDQAQKEKRSFSSQNYNKTRIGLAKIHEKISQTRSDFLHKTSRHIFSKNQTVVMETLKVKNMMKNRRLSKSIGFQSWGQFILIMKMKAEEYEKNLRFVSQWYPSSQICHCCAYKYAALKLSEREWACPQCGDIHDRDINAAINIKNEGGSYPVKPVERKSSVHRPKRRTTMASMKEESSRFEIQVH